MQDKDGMNYEKTDEKLVLEIRDGNERSFNTLVSRWYKRIYNYALRYGNDTTLAEEVTQKAFIRVYQKINTLKDVSKFKPWFYRIANNYCVTETRKNVRKRKVMAEVENTPVIADYTSAQTSFEKNEKCQLVRQALQQIPEEQRQVIIMKEYEGLKFREIADILGESENTIKSRMYYGLDAMRKLLTQLEWTKELYYE